MARLHKVSMFVLDVGEYYEDIEELVEELFDRTEASAHFIDAETSQFPWYDDIVLNQGDATKQDYEDFMNITERRRCQMEKTVESKYGEIKKSVKGVMENLGLSTSDEDMIEFLNQINSNIEFHMGEY